MSPRLKTQPSARRTLLPAVLSDLPVALAALLLVLVLAGCDPADKGSSAIQGGRKWGAQGAAPAAASPAHGLSSAQRLAGLPRVAVQGNYAGDFQVAAREGKIQRFPCRECHDRSVGKLKAAIPVKLRGTHREIKRAHAPKSTLTCLACHADSDGMNTLRLADGTAVGFDHSYRVCAQCHFEQARAWAGGGHGKRLGGWAPPRVVENCAACHNPHDPLRPVSTPRWPSVVPNAPARRAGH